MIPFRTLLYLFVLMLYPAIAQANDRFCGIHSKSWNAIMQNAEASPQALAESYISKFGKTQLGREAQAVFYRMKSTGTGLEEALSAHLEAYHANKTNNVRTEIQTQVRDQLALTAEVYELIIFYESFRLTPEIVEARIRKVSSRNSSQPELYVKLLRDRAANYLQKGESEHIAYLKAYIEAWNRYELDSGMLGVDPLVPGTDCFADELFKFDSSFRSRALGANPIGKVKEPGMGKNQLAYLTSRKFGSHYVMVRGAVFEGAAR